MNIEKFTLIKRQDLDEGAYFESLMEKALELKLITDNAIEAIQDECLNLLAQNLRRAYGDMSDSVSEERAESMMDSIIYTLGVGLKTFVYAALKGSTKCFWVSVKCLTFCKIHSSPTRTLCLSARLQKYCRRF